MKLKKIFKYGFIATCLLGNALAMDHTDDLPKNAVPRNQSMLAIKAASDTASLESRQLHILFGAHPSETHVVHLRAAEEKREKEEGIKAPIRLFFVNACELYGEQALSPKTPILNADFNKEESWDTILEALKLNEESFNGVFDKMYFDVSTAKAASWGESILAKITILLKKSGELYIPDVKLFSQSSFCESTVDMATYSKLTKTEKNALPYPPYLNTPVYPLSPPFLLGRCTAEVIKRGDIGYVYIANLP